jgi:hypothetical protein
MAIDAGSSPTLSGSAHRRAVPVEQQRGRRSASVRVALADPRR